MLVSCIRMSLDEEALAIPFSAKSYQVVAMDFPAHSKSDVPDQGFSVEGYARSVINSWTVWESKGAALLVTTACRWM